MSISLFPPGTPVCIKQVVVRRDNSYEVEVVGVVESWEDFSPIGSEENPPSRPSASRST